MILYYKSVQTPLILYFFYFYLLKMCQNKDCDKY